MHSTVMAVSKRKYRYDNQISAYLKPGNLNNVNNQRDATGESVSQIVNEALDEYFKKRKAAARAASKNTY